MSEYTLDQIHIDVARNATDDFNPFHDPVNWRNIRDNPFGMPIALGFQLEALVAHLVDHVRCNNGEADLIVREGLNFSNYQITFADVVRPGEPFQVKINKSSDRIATHGQLSNRISVAKGRRLVLLGFQRETKTPLFMAERNMRSLPDLERSRDRSFVEGGRYFLKRKYMNTSNGKNFLVGSLIDQHDYFDELSDRVSFPPMFPVAMLSCALLEKARREAYRFEEDPVVYTGHEISLDRRMLRSLKSNDPLHMLVEGPIPVPGDKGLGSMAITQSAYHCFGLTRANKVVYRARLTMAPLHELKGAF